MSLTAPAKRPAHHKKVSGGHHRHSKHYLKTYYPYLPLLLIVLVGLAINLFWTARTGVLGARTSLTSTELLQDTNAERSAGDEDSLKLSTKLSAAAQAKANDMVARNYWSHTTPDGKTPWTFISGSGYSYYTAGENLAYGFSNAEDTINGWMNSREHRANILNADFTEVGFGIAPAHNFQGHKDTTVIVAMYAEPAIIVDGNAASSASTDLPGEIPVRSVARIQLMTHGEAPWSLLLASVVSLLALYIFFRRHYKIWKRVVVESEEFVIHHKFLDFLFIATAVAGFVLTRSAGFIH